MTHKPATFSEKYLAGDPEAIRFLKRDYRSPASRGDSVTIARSRHISRELGKLLLAFNRQLSLSPARDNNIQALIEGKAVAVITGQQMGLFLGPVFTLYKALTAIKVARALTEETGVKAVPVFWLQSEDHDFQEIAHIFIPSTTGEPIRLEIPNGAAHQQEIPFQERMSVKYRLLGEGVLTTIHTLEATLAHFSTTKPFVELLKQHYQPENNFCNAFAEVLGSILAQEGLVFFDPTFSGISQITAPIFRKAFVHWKNIEDQLSIQIQELEQANFQAQVPIRKSSPLFFYHKDSPAGPRFRLQRTDDSAWALLGDKEILSEATVETHLREKPELFSSSALLRPIIQDFLFPTVAYIAGPAEINYFAELPRLYEIFDLPFPLIIPRASFLCVESREQKLLEELKLSTTDLQLPFLEIIPRVINVVRKQYKDPNLRQQELVEDINKAFDKTRQSFADLDSTLVDSLEKTRQKVLKQLEPIKERYLKALVQKNDIIAKRVIRLQNMLFPEGTEQERFYAGAYFLCRYGNSFLVQVMEQIYPFEGRQREIKLYAKETSHSHYDKKWDPGRSGS